MSLNALSGLTHVLAAPNHTGWAICHRSARGQSRHAPSTRLEFAACAEAPMAVSTGKDRGRVT